MSPDSNSNTLSDKAVGASAKLGHVPVLLAEVLDCLNPTAGKFYVDVTLGGGGHSRAILERLVQEPSVQNQWLGVDQDSLILDKTRSSLETEFVDSPVTLYFAHGNYSQLPALLQQQGLASITGGILADIGVSSFQLDQAERGFSFNKEAPLDMRMNPEGDLTASTVVNTYPEAELLQIFSEYGEERMSKTIAKAIVERRKTKPFETTLDLANLISGLYEQIIGRKHFRIHPATCVFQALRMEVNQELQHLEKFLEEAPKLLAPGGRLAVISFHSLEDRLVKHAFKELCPKSDKYAQSEGVVYKLLTKKPITPTDAEIKINPRSRSAKLRVIERVH
jgi:16S rRNA (cytosine1402-N4)-methyltransferase